jgi:hypothetical protein
VKGAVHDVGKVAEYGAPALNFVPGVGPGLAATIGGLGGLAAGDGVMGGIRGAFGGYLPGAAGVGSAATAGSGLAGVEAAGKAAIPQLAKSMGLSGLMGMGSGAASAAGSSGDFNPSSGPSVGVTGDGTNPGVSVPTDYGTNGGDSSGGGLLSQFRPLLSGVGNALGLTGGSGPGGLNLSNLLQTGAGAEGVYNALQSNKLRSQAMDAATQNFAQRAPLRTAGVNMLSPITRQSSMAPYVNQANPFAQSQFRTLNGTGA